jgi:signal transduction histidine kinase
MGDAEFTSTGPNKVSPLHDRVAALERENAAMYQRLENSEGNGKVVSKIAHDFNNLLTIINGYSLFLADRLDLNDEVRLDLLSIARAGARAAELTSRLSELGRKMRADAGAASSDSTSIKHQDKAETT